MKTSRLNIRFASAALIALAAVTAIAARPTVAHAQGVITGQVLDDDSELAVTGAVVRIETLGREVLTDRSGRFVITGVPAGQQALRTRYLGFAPANQTVTVVDGRSVNVTFRIRPTETTLGAVTVVASRAGQAAALNQQKNAPNVTNVVAADQIGRFPDANLGDALKRIPGITIGLDQGETRFGSIRGTEPRFNSVMINGERVPSAEAEVREVQLDLIPADMVQAIEVNKTLTPDMDADAIGGAVNVVTRAAPAGFRLSATAGSGFNFIREQPVLIGGLVAGNRFLNDKLGVIGSASYYDQQFGSDNKEGVWNRTAAGEPFMRQFDLRRYDVQRVRRSVSASVDYRFDDNNVVMLRSMYNNRDDFENRWRERSVLGAPNAQGMQVASEIRRQTKGGGDGRPKFTRLEDQRTQSHQLSGEHLIANRATLSWSGSLAQASETRPDERYIEWRSRNVQINSDYSDEQNPQFNPVNPAAVLPSAFTFRRIESQESFTKDQDMNGRVDLRVPLTEGDYASAVKVGGRYRGKEKLRENSFLRLAPVNGSTFANLTTNDNSDFSVENNLIGNYRYGTFTTPEFLGRLDLRNPALFNASDRPDEYAAGNFDATETVTGGYAMLEQRFGPAVSAILGVRLENTSIGYNGFEYNVDTDAVSPTTGSQSYTDVLPGINVRWDAAPNTVIRAAWTNTLARPNYFDLVPYREISIDDDELALGNPDLAPTRAMNFDLMAERFYDNVGLFSVGVFHKNITDFIFNSTRFQSVDPITGRTFAAISQPQNGASATLTGIETAFQRQLDFLPGALRNLGLYVNYTFNESGVSGLGLDGRDQESLPLLGTARHSGNFSVSYDTRRINARVALNYQSESLDANEGGYNEDAFFDRWADRRTDIDANVNFRITPVMQLFVEANNLNNRPLRFYQGVRGRLMQDEFYGRRIQSGFRFDF